MRIFRRRRRRKEKKRQEEPTLSGSWYLSPSWLERFFPRDRLSGRHAPGTFSKARSTAHNGRARSPKQKPCFCRFVHLSPFHFLPTSSPSDSPGKQPHEGYARSLALDSLFTHTPAEKKTFHVQGLHASEISGVFRSRAVTDLVPKFIHTLQDQILNYANRILLFKIRHRHLIYSFNMLTCVTSN